MFSNLAIHLCKITLHLCFAWLVTYIPVVSMMISKMAVIARKHQDKLCFYFYKLLKFNRIRRKADQTRWEMKVSSVPGLAYPLTDLTWVTRVTLWKDAPWVEYLYVWNRKCKSLAPWACSVTTSCSLSMLSRVYVGHVTCKSYTLVQYCGK